MAEFFLELLSEEIPARMQDRAARDLAERLGRTLESHTLPHQTPRGFVTPRRLTVVAEGLPLAQADRVEEKRGPKVGAPDRAVQGFLAANGLDSLDQCETRDIKGQPYYFARIERPGRPAADVLRDILPALLDQLAWPKSMRWDSHGTRWVRPLRNLLCLFDGKPLDIAYGGLTAGNHTFGHRVHAPKAFTVENFADYRAKLSAAKVMLDRDERKAHIRQNAEALASERGLRIVEDDGLIDEIAGLVEWPVALVGDFDPAYLDLPTEVLTAEMRHHQKYLALRDDSGNLSPHFVVIANLETPDGGNIVANGNARVLRARLADARFFWNQDRKQMLESRLPMLAGRIFHAELGHMEDKARRISRLAGQLAAHIPGATPDLAERAGLLAKADLAGGMVGEFPELQGIMGGYYARHDGEPEEVVTAISSHYAPQGPGDSCPDQPVALAVALADKIDTLAGFFSIGEKPTGSKDPYALRRAALGIVRMILEHRLRLPLRDILTLAEHADAGTVDALLHFLGERIRLHLREQGFRHDLVSAVLALGDDDIVRVADRLEALRDFLAGEDGANLLTAYARARNIVAIEEKRDGVRYDGPPDPEQFTEPEESNLLNSLDAAGRASSAAIQKEDFQAAMSALAELRRPVDAFFDRVTVNAEDAEKRVNRLRMLARIRGALDQVAAFSELEG